MCNLHQKLIDMAKNPSVAIEPGHEARLGLEAAGFIDAAGFITDKGLQCAAAGEVPKTINVPAKFAKSERTFKFLPDDVSDAELERQAAQALGFKGL